MDTKETLLLKEAVHGKGHPAANAENIAEQIRAWPQVGDRAEELGCVALLLQRIRRIGLTQHPQVFRLHLPFLPGGW